jgi:DNA-binding transcriptional LysR family regulator
MNPLPPIDLYGLRLLRLVAEHQSITAAAQAAGLTQSALTRQVKGMEERIGVALFERTTRRLKVTAAGKLFLKETEGISGLLEAAVRQVQESHLGLPGELRVGVSRSVALAHLPGLLHGFLRQDHGVALEVSHLGGAELLEAVAQNRLDAGILGAPRRLPVGCRITHRMADRFVLIAPAALPVPSWAVKASGFKPARWTKEMRQHLAEANWLMLPPAMQTRHDMDAWLRKCAVEPQRTAVLDSFDLIIQLVALGLGIALVPRRAIAHFPRQKQLRVWMLPEQFERELVVVTRQAGAVSPQVKAFVESILFS